MDNYECLENIGEGTYGVVVKARHKGTGQIVAIKKFKESDADEQVRKTALREIRILKQLKHTNIVSLIEVFRHNGKLYLVFEYVERTLLEDLEGNPRGLAPRDAKKIFFQLLRSLDFIHRNNIIHRDIKPENLLLSKTGVLKLCDFGFARGIAGKNSVYTDYVATRWYRCPELLVGDTDYDKLVDVWAAGCLLAEIVNGMPLFPGESDLDQLYHIMACFGRLTPRHEEIFRKNPLYVGVKLPEPTSRESLQQRFTDVDPNIVDIMQCCLQLAPSLRSSCDSLLEHPFFHGFAEDFDRELSAAVEKDREESLAFAKLRKKIKSRGKRRESEDYTGAKAKIEDEEEDTGELGGSVESLHLEDKGHVKKSDDEDTPISPKQSRPASRNPIPPSDLYGVKEKKKKDKKKKEQKVFPPDALPLLAARTTTPRATRLVAFPSLADNEDDRDYHWDRDPREDREWREHANPSRDYEDDERMMRKPLGSQVPKKADSFYPQIQIRNGFSHGTNAQFSGQKELFVPPKNLLKIDAREARLDTKSPLLPEKRKKKKEKKKLKATPLPTFMPQGPPLAVQRISPNPLSISVSGGGYSHPSHLQANYPSSFHTNYTGFYGARAATPADTGPNDVYTFGKPKKKSIPQLAAQGYKRY